MPLLGDRGTLRNSEACIPPTSRDMDIRVNFYQEWDNVSSCFTFPHLKVDVLKVITFPTSLAVQNSSIGDLVTH